MNGISWFLSVLALGSFVAIVVAKRQKNPKRVMWEGKLLKSEIVWQDGENRFLRTKTSKSQFNEQYQKAISQCRLRHAELASAVLLVVEVVFVEELVATFL